MDDNTSYSKDIADLTAERPRSAPAAPSSPAASR